MNKSASRVAGLVKKPLATRIGAHGLTIALSGSAIAAIGLVAFITPLDWLHSFGAGFSGIGIVTQGGGIILVIWGQK